MNNEENITEIKRRSSCGPKKTGFDEDTVGSAKQVKVLVEEGIQVGSRYRRAISGEDGPVRILTGTKADQIGMLATVMNCIYVQKFVRAAGMKTSVLTPFECGSLQSFFKRPGQQIF